MHNGERSILIVVPRNGQDACRSLSHTFADDSTVEVIRKAGGHEGKPVPPPPVTATAGK